MAEVKDILQEYVATANNPQYKSDWNIINSKFPELKGYDAKLLQEYVATANNPKYNSNFETINSKFPELFNTQQRQVNGVGVLKSTAQDLGFNSSMFKIPTFNQPTTTQPISAKKPIGNPTKEQLLTGNYLIDNGQKGFVDKSVLGTGTQIVQPETVTEEVNPYLVDVTDKSSDNTQVNEKGITPVSKLSAVNTLSTEELLNTDKEQVRQFLNKDKSQDQLDFENESNSNNNIQKFNGEMSIYDAHIKALNDRSKYYESSLKAKYGEDFFSGISKQNTEIQNEAQQFGLYSTKRKKEYDRLVLELKDIEKQITENQLPREQAEPMYNAKLAQIKAIESDINGKRNDIIKKQDEVNSKIQDADFTTYIDINDKINQLTNEANSTISKPEFAEYRKLLDEGDKAQAKKDVMKKAYQEKGFFGKASDIMGAVSQLSPVVMVENLITGKSDETFTGSKVADEGDKLLGRTLKALKSIPKQLENINPLGDANKYDYFDAVFDQAIYASKKRDMLNPTATDVQRDIIQKYADVDGYKVMLDENGTPTSDVRDSKFYKVNEKIQKEIFDKYRQNPSAYETQSDFGASTLATKATPTILDMGTMMATAMLSGGTTGLLAGAGTAGTVSTATTIGVSAAQMYGDMYESGLTAGLTPQEANDFATLTSIMTGMVSLVNPMESNIVRGTLSRNIGRFLPRVITSADVQLIRNGRLSLADLAKLTVKEGVKNTLGENFEELVLEPAVQRATETYYNTKAQKNGQQGFEDLNKPFFDTKQTIETAMITSMTSLLLTPIEVSNSIPEQRKIALQNALDNPTQFVAMREKMLEDGDIEKGKFDYEVKAFEEISKQYNAVKPNIKEDLHDDLAELLLKKYTLKNTMSQVNDEVLNKKNQLLLDDINKRLEEVADGTYNKGKEKALSNIANPNTLIEEDKIATYNGAEVTILDDLADGEVVINTNNPEIGDDGIITVEKSALTDVRNKPKDIEQVQITSAVININGKEYEGKNHAEAILKAQADGQDISQVDRQAEGLFKLSDGTIINREQAKEQFGQDRSELIIPQDEAAKQANKDYAKITKLNKQIETLSDDDLYIVHLTNEGNAKNIFESSLLMPAGNASTTRIVNKETLSKILDDLSKGKSEHRGYLDLFIGKINKSELEKQSGKQLSDKLESYLEDNHIEDVAKTQLPSSLNFGYFSNGELVTKNTKSNEQTNQNASQQQNDSNSSGVAGSEQNGEAIRAKSEQGKLSNQSQVQNTTTAETEKQITEIKKVIEELESNPNSPFSKLVNLDEQKQKLAELEKNISQQKDSTKTENNLPNGKDISEMTQEEFAQWIQDNKDYLHSIESNSTSMSGASITVKPFENSYYDLLTLRPELREAYIRNKGVLTEVDFEEARAYYKSLQNEEGKYRNSDSNPDWLQFNFGNTNNTEVDGNRRKGYITIDEKSLNNFKGNIPNLISELNKALDGKYNGSFKVAQKLSTLINQFDNIVIHGANAQEVQTALEIINKTLIENGIENTISQIGIDGKNKKGEKTSHTRLLEEKIQNSELEAKNAKEKGTTEVTPTSTNQPESNPALKDVESTAKALEKVDTKSLKTKLGVDANWDMIGEGDLFDSKSPEDRYTQRLLSEWYRASQKGEINPNSKITYDIVRGRFGGQDQKDVVQAKDENGIIIGVVKLSGKLGIEHIAVAPEFRGKGVADKLIKMLKENNPNLDLSKTELRSKGFDKAFGNKIIAEAYHKAKADGSNPELVKAVEEALTPQTENTKSNEEQPTNSDNGKKAEHISKEQKLKNDKHDRMVGLMREYNSTPTNKKTRKSERQSINKLASDLGYTVKGKIGDKIDILNAKGKVIRKINITSDEVTVTPEVIEKTKELAQGWFEWNGNELDYHIDASQLGLTWQEIRRAKADLDAGKTESTNINRVANAINEYGNMESLPLVRGFGGNYERIDVTGEDLFWANKVNETTGLLSSYDNVSESELQSLKELSESDEKEFEQYSDLYGKFTNEDGSINWEEALKYEQENGTTETTANKGAERESGGNDISNSKNSQLEKEKGVNKTQNHQVYYNGKVVDMGYITNPKEQFKYASQRISDNLGTGGNTESVGYVKTPDGKIFEVSRSNKSAKILSGDELISAQDKFTPKDSSKQQANKSLSKTEQARLDIENIRKEIKDNSADDFNLFAVFDPKREAQRQYNSHVLLVKLVKAYINLGVASINDIATKIGISIKNLRNAFDEATGKKSYTLDDMLDATNHVDLKEIKDAIVEGDKKAINEAYILAQAYLEATDFEYNTEARDEFIEKVRNNPLSKAIFTETQLEKIYDGQVLSSVDKIRIKYKMLIYDIKNNNRLSKQQIQQKQQEMADDIKGLINNNLKSITGKQAEKFINLANKAVTNNSPAYLARIINQIANLADQRTYQKAKTLYEIIKARSKRKGGVQSGKLTGVLQDFATINPLDVSDIAKYVELAEKVKQASNVVKQPTDADSDLVYDEVQAYVKAQQDEINSNAINDTLEDDAMTFFTVLDQKAKAKFGDSRTFSELTEPEQREVFESITKDDIKKYGFTDDERAMIEAFKEIKTEQKRQDFITATYNKIGELKDLLANSVGVITQSPAEKEITDALLNVKLDDMTATEMARVLKLINGITQNNDYSGGGAFVAQQKSVEVNSKMNTLKSEIGEFRKLSEGGSKFRNFQQISVAMAKGKKLGAKLMEASGINSLMRGIAKTKTYSHNLQKAFKAEKFKSSVFEPISQMRQSIYAAVIQTKIGDDIKEAEHIARWKRIIEKNIENLRTINKEGYKEQADLLQKALDEVIGDRQQLKDIADNMSKIDSEGKRVVQFFTDNHAEQKPRFRENSLLFHNKEIEEYNSYTKLSITSLTGDTVRDTGEKLMNDARSTGITKKKSKSMIDRANYESLNDNTGLDFNFINKQMKALGDNEYDINTSADITTLANAFNSDNKQLRELLGAENFDLLKGKLQTILGTANYEETTIVDDVINEATKISRVIALGSITQALKQATVLLSTYINSAGTDNLRGVDFKLITGTQREKDNLHKLMAQSEIGARRAESAGGFYDNTSIKKNISDGFAKKTAKYFGRGKDFASDVSMGLLRWADIKAADLSWITFYKKYLRDNNLTFDENNEFKNPNKDAMAYAETMVQTAQGANTEAGQADLWNMAKGVTQMVFPFMSFAIQGKARLVDNLMNIANGDDRVEALRDTAGYIGEQLAFNTIKLFIGIAVTQQLLPLLLEALELGDDEDDRLSEEQKKNKKLVEDIRKEKQTNANFWNNIIKDLTYGTAPLIDNNLTVPLINGIVNWRKAPYDLLTKGELNKTSNLGLIPEYKSNDFNILSGGTIGVGVNQVKNLITDFNMITDRSVFGDSESESQVSIFKYKGEEYTIVHNGRYTRTDMFFSNVEGRMDVTNQNVPADIIKAFIESPEDFKLVEEVRKKGSSTDDDLKLNLTDDQKAYAIFMAIVGVVSFAGINETTLNTVNNKVRAEMKKQVIKK